MVIGAFGPWAKAVGLVNVSVGGTDASNDGWGVVVAAVVGAAALVLYWRGRTVLIGGTLLGARTWAVLTVLAGGASAALTIVDRGDVTDAANENTSALVDLQVGWGLNLAMAASLVLAIVGLVALVRYQSAPAMRADSDAVTAVAAEPEVSTMPKSTAAEIHELSALHERGVLTDEEFRLAKHRALTSTNAVDET
jgi:hypothetical protein